MTANGQQEHQSGETSEEKQRGSGEKLREEDNGLAETECYREKETEAKKKKLIR